VSQLRPTTRPAPRELRPSTGATSGPPIGPAQPCCREDKLSQCLSASRGWRCDFCTRSLTKGIFKKNCAADPPLLSISVHARGLPLRAAVSVKAGPRPRYQPGSRCHLGVAPSSQKVTHWAHADAAIADEACRKPRLAASPALVCSGTPHALQAEPAPCRYPCMSPRTKDSAGAICLEMLATLPAPLAAMSSPGVAAPMAEIACAELPRTRALAQPCRAYRTR